MDGIKDCVECITDAYTCLLNGSPPNQIASDLVTNICAVLCRNVTLQDDSCLCAWSNTAKCSHVNMTELTCITLTLVDKIHVDLMSQTMRPETTLYLSQIQQVFQEANVMSRLVHRFHTDDQMISHLAAKCVSSYVSYQLHTSVSIEGEINQIWQQTCVQAFQNGPTGKELDPCMWSFISVFKILLKDSDKRKTEILQKLLMAFDPHLTTLVSRFLPEEEVDDGLSAVHLPTNTRSWGVTFSSLLDLLEILCASRLMCSTDVCSPCQRLAYRRARPLIKTAASSSCDYILKRRVLLLMKRTLLQKAGEDLALGEISAPASRDEHFGTDMGALADTVLGAVSAEWLRFVPVEMVAAASFGGPYRGPGQGGGRNRKPDHVMLRAVGLVVLKSLELTLQTGAAADRTVEACLGVLFGFLQDRGVPLAESSHLCCWYLLVFTEQDDDMMEAAKTLLALYLRYNSRCPGLNPEAVSATSCSSGFNPHCHFLLFLRSVSFDPSTLLDFLISSETCFLEYLVRYLKHLRADFPGFLLACRKMEESDPRVRAQLSFSVPVRVGTPGTTHAASDRDRTKLFTRPTAHVPTRPASTGLGSGLCLVDYSSSDESGSEEMEVSQASHKDADEGNRRAKLPDSEKRAMSALADDNLPDRKAQVQDVVCDHGQERPTPYLGLAASQFGQTTGLAHTQGGRTLTRSLLCLSDLRRVVAKLNTKNLFPYNPKSLLKLLAQAEEVHLSHLSPNT
ncbi:protein Lines homolog 1 isoform X1 [Gadus morhua]|uniref:Lines homolog 1 n=1 Tax=Gadus morhua TaxID=8049 RepID=A0A8C5F9A9_GADMO|nr:protein Lines homolog 1 isoform X1 [Gadus morhua]